jgi:5'-3' exonuclease
LEYHLENMNNETAKITKRPYLIIDGFNNFIRHYLVNPTVSSDGEPIGGVVGFIKTIYHLTNTFAPERIYVVWEAGGGSARRKKMFPSYKANRSRVDSHTIVTRNESGLKKELRLDQQTKIKQLTILTKFLATTPICQIYLKGTEADDIVAYIAKDKFGYDHTVKKIIVSGDKDFYQLLENPSIEIYEPQTRKIWSGKKVKEVVGIAPNNFCLAKALSGDSSDNVPGIKGVGFKTLIKRFEEFGNEEKDYTMNQILSDCEELKKTSKLKIYESITENKHVIDRNWKLMYLSTSTMSAYEINKINYAIDTFKPSNNKFEMIKVITGNKIAIPFNFDSMFESLKKNLTYT